MEFRNHKFARRWRFRLMKTAFGRRTYPPLIRRKGAILYYGPRPFKLNQF